MGTRGPAPDPNALRRDRPSDAASWVDLPPRRDGPPPAWPAHMGEPRPGTPKALLWADLWTLPQAVMWERHRRHIEVALYVDTLLSIQDGPPPDVKTDPTPALRTLALRQQDVLGLTSGSLARHRWRITGVEPERKSVRTDDPDRTSARARLQALQGGRPAS